MKIPRLTMSGAAPGPSSAHGARGGASAPHGVVPMAVAFSPNWTIHSYTADGTLTEGEEVTLIMDMLRNSTSAAVRDAANGVACDVYVRTGVHRSPSDAAEHVQVKLGLNTEPWFSGACPTRTCHIAVLHNNAGQYPTQCWNN